MALQNLKNFIRRGRQAYDSPSTVLTTDPVMGLNSHSQIDSTVDQSQNQSHADNQPQSSNPPHPTSTTPVKELPDTPTGADLYNEAANRIVQEEEAKKSKMPTYPGLDNYLLLDQMGEGAFSIVYRAQDLTTKEFVAVKVIKKYEMDAIQAEKVLGREGKRARELVKKSSILKEVAIMRQLRHRNIVSFYRFIEANQYYHIIQELVPGGELFQEIVRLTYFSENLSRHVIRQVGEAVRYLHEEAGIVHRDIKPENLLFYPIEFKPSKKQVFRKGDDPSQKVDEGEFLPGIGSGGIGIIKLADFGLSKQVWDSKTKTPCGTVGYTAPEIVRDERYTKSVDMWAIGCVLYTILCGFPPFYDENIETLTEKVAKGQYTFLSPWWDDISKDAKDLVSHLLTVDPDKRFTIDEMLNHKWMKQGTVLKDNASDYRQLVKPLANTSIKSPAAVTLREIFDVSNAVHRMEEEGALRKGGGNLGMLNEYEEDSDDDHDEELTIQFEPNSSRSRGRGRKPRVFDLSLDGATLLERRKKKNNTIDMNLNFDDNKLKV